MVYCGQSCALKDIENHVKICARFWCAVDAHQKRMGSFNSVPCETSHRKHICHSCHEIKLLKTKVCKNCKSARYCSIQCQTKDWKAFHKKMCSTHKAFQCNQQLRKELQKNGMVVKTKKNLYWSVTKNGKSLPEKYQTLPEAEKACDQIREENKDEAFYGIGAHEMILFSKRPSDNDSLH